MKKVLFLGILLIMSAMLFGGYITPAPGVQPIFYLGTTWKAMYPIEVTELSSTTWTDVSATNRGVIAICENYDTVLVVAKSATEADTLFAAGQFSYLEDGQGNIVPDQQRDSLYRIYLKCNSEDIINDTIDAAAAVDKAVTPEKVGIPVTGHTFTVYDYVTIAGSTAYDGTFMVISQTANEIVIYHAYTAEVFAGTETIISTPTITSIKGR